VPALGALLGVDGAEEQVFAAIPLYADPARTIVRAPAADRLDALPTIAPDYRRADGFTYTLPPLFTGIATQSVLDRDDAPAIETPAFHCTRAAADTIPAPPENPARAIELAEALRTRCSGNVMFHPIATPLRIHELWTIIRHALAPYPCDRRDAGVGVQASLFIAAFHVDELAAGVYQYCPDHRGLHRLADGDVSLALQGAIAVPNLNLCACPAVLYVAADHPTASRVFGNRAYRMITMECGVIAQRICTMSASHGLAARLHNGYDAAVVERVLGIAASDLTPLFQIAIAHNRPGVQHGLPIVF
jgi:hypothetical protein